MARLRYLRQGTMTAGGRHAPPPATRWHRMPDPGALVRAVVQRILVRAQAAIADHAAFRIVLAGGSTPQAVYRALAATPSDWSCWQVYFGDERCLPADDPQRNSVPAMQNWLGRVAIPDSNIHPIPAELGAEAAAAAYTGIVAGARPFDLVLLGVGEDGHTASLFPGQHHATGAAVHAVHAAPKPPAERVTLGVEALNDSVEVLILATGSSKRAAVQRWKAGADLPVAHIHGLHGADVYLDAAADQPVTS